MVEGIVSLFRGFYIDLECVFGFFLTNVFIEGLWAEVSLQRQILLCHICCDHSFFHLYHYSIIIV